jgi:hypothetical protein
MHGLGQCLFPAWLFLLQKGWTLFVQGNAAGCIQAAMQSVGICGEVAGSREAAFWCLRMQWCDHPMDVCAGGMWGLFCVLRATGAG